MKSCSLGGTLELIIACELIKTCSPNMLVLAGYGLANCDNTQKKFFWEEKLQKVTKSNKKILNNTSSQYYK